MHTFSIKSQFYTYQIAMQEGMPFPLREGIVFEMQTDDRACSYGEITPLPKWSIETLDDAIHQLNLLQENSFSIPKEKLFPSVAFGIEMANNIYADKAIIHKELCYSHLLIGNKEQIIAKIQNLPRGGCAKLKTSKLSLQDVFDITSLLIQKNIAPCIDPNQLWSKEETIAFCTYFSPDQIRYLEEPVQSLKELIHLATMLPHRFAVDQTLRKTPIKQLLEYPFRDWILKPSLMGGMTPCIHYASIARQNGIEAYLSSSWESGLGLYYIIDTYRKSDLFSAPLGLDTYYFLEDTLQKPIRFISGIIYLPEQITLNHDVLTQIPHGIPS